MRAMGLVNIRYRAGRGKPWRAQWRESEGGKLVPREKWFPGPPAPADQPEWIPEALAKFKAQHEGEAEKFEDLALTSTDRARWWRIKQDCEAEKVSIEAAVAAGIAALKKLVAKSEPIERALGLWELDAKDRKLRPKSIESIKSAVGLFAKKREASPVSEFTAAELLRWTAERYTSQGSRDDVLGRLLTFFRWCASSPRKWCNKAEFTEVKWEHKVKGEKKRVGFYFAEEARALLEAVPAGLKPAMALGFFLGVRPHELMRIRLAWIDAGEFYGFDEKRGEWHLAPEWTKTRAYRKLYALPDCWWYWWIKYKSAIVPHKRQKKRAGMLVPVNYRNFKKAMSRARIAAGIAKTPHDGFHRSEDGKERGVEWCISNMGHVGGYRVFEASYDGKVSSAEAVAYYLIYPEGAACEVRTRARIIGVN
jgi:integrase